MVTPMIDEAVRLGEAMLAARARQAAFESRLLNKSICVATLFGTASVSGDAHSSVAVVEQDGMAIVASRAELMQLSMHAAPLPRLGLAPLVRQTELQAADLPSIVPLHSVAMDAAAARVFALHVDGCMLVWGGRHGELRHSAHLLPTSAMASAPSHSLLSVNEESQLVAYARHFHPPARAAPTCPCAPSFHPPRQRRLLLARWHGAHPRTAIARYTHRRRGRLAGRTSRHAPCR